MITVISYFAESSAVLLGFLVLYHVFLRNETNFRLVRAIMVSGLIGSVILPLIKIESPHAGIFIPSVERSISELLLPAVTISSSKGAGFTSALSMLEVLSSIYIIGVAASVLIFARQLLEVRKARLHGEVQTMGRFKIISTDRYNYSFSFFRNIYITKKEQFTDVERAQVLAHERAHADACHSMDLILVAVCQIVFWFNPLITFYRRALVQVHEFEADSRAVRDNHVDGYCSLLAKVALHSAGLRFASQFNNSLTIKRIKMLRKAKSKINTWKLSASALIVAAILSVVSCQDQIRESSGEISDEAMEHFYDFQKIHTGETYIVEKNDQLKANLSSLEEKYGKPTSAEEFSINTASGSRTFVMLEYTTANDEPVLTTVDAMPEYPGGFEAMAQLMQSNLHYPENARNAGIEGTVFASFIVEKNGAISNVQIKKGLSAECDKESVRVIKLFPKFKPAEHNGKPARVSMVLPIRFKL